MPRLRLLAAIACFSCVFLHPAADPRIYLQHDWYVVEMVVFERIDAPPSPEHLVHGSDYRIFSADLRSISPSKYQQRNLEEAVQAHSSTDSQPVFDSSTESGMNDAVQSDSRATSSTSDYVLATESSVFDEGCWLHQRTLSVTNFDLSVSDELEQDIEPLENSEEHVLFDDQFVFGGDLPQATRNPGLPDWLPDEWETDEVIMYRVGRVLGLCEEDLITMIASQALEQVTEDEDSDEMPLSAQVVEQEYAAYERELYRETGTRRDPETWTLARAASRLSNEGYRIIDHAAWHQDALERGANKPLLVQFGQSHPGSRFEVEGTVVLSSARFLHLDIDLWKSIEPNESPTEIDQLPRLLYYSMQESRRLTLGKTHYFDHPKFGLLVRIQRLPVPQRLVSLLEQLDNAF